MGEEGIEVEINLFSYFQGMAVQHNDQEGTPPKPPPPVLPQKPVKSPKQKLEQQMKLDLVQDSTGSDSTSSNVRERRC